MPECVRQEQDVCSGCLGVDRDINEKLIPHSPTLYPSGASLNVFCNDKNASRVTSPAPHGTVPIGSPDTFINDEPLHRKFDKSGDIILCQCKSYSGSPNTFCNDSGPVVTTLGYEESIPT